MREPKVNEVWWVTRNGSAPTLGRRAMDQLNRMKWFVPDISDDYIMGDDIEPLDGPVSWDEWKRLRALDRPALQRGVQEVPDA